MPELKSSFIPLTDLESPKIRMAVTLPPFIDSDRIGINLHAITILQRLSGISHLRVGGITGAQTSGFTPNIGGIDSQGGIYAARTAAGVSVPSYSSETQEKYPDRAFGARLVNGSIKINLDEVGNKIRSEQRWKGGAHSVEAWSYHLDKSLKGGISNIGIKHLMRDFNKIEYFWMAAVNILGPASLSVTYAHGLEATAFLNGVLFYNLFMNGVNSLVSSVAQIEEGWRFSCIFGPQIDRALILKYVAKTQTLVKPLS